MDVAPNVKGFMKTPAALLALNALIALSAGGLLFYSKLMHKRPPITESGERVRLAQAHASPVPGAKRGTMIFDALTVNIESLPPVPLPADGTKRQIEGKLHYATIGFALELRDETRKAALETLRPLMLDKFLTLTGRKSFRELTTVQGRYLLRTQLLDRLNELALERLGDEFRDGPVTNIFFTQFIVQ
ncbi:MAG: hypothetical protein A2X94_05170 [Bdellovibrionales bacterium GWB1_55_8]|nr:MAG: hypothetical protein A2X94_05170 [Bdellovibrionales bacterium GWB1_55_8]